MKIRGFEYDSNPLKGIYLCNEIGATKRNLKYLDLGVPEDSFDSETEEMNICLNFDETDKCIIVVMAIDTDKERLYPQILMESYTKHEDIIDSENIIIKGFAPDLCRTLDELNEIIETK